MGDGVTAGDETGARAEQLRVTREEHEHKHDVYPGTLCSGCFLLSEFDRVTARLHLPREGDLEAIRSAEEERDHWKRVAETHWAQILKDAPLTPTGKQLLEQTIASRNAWAQKAVERSHEVERLREALSWLRQTIHQAYGHDGEIPACRRNTCQAASEALAATEPKETKQ